MIIDMDKQTEAHVREMAFRVGMPFADYVRAALMRQMEQDERRSAPDETE